VSSWATRTHASLRPLVAADAPARSRAWILAQRKGCGRVPIAIKKNIRVHAIRAAAMSAQSPDLSLDRGIPRLGLGCHVQPLGPPLPSATVGRGASKERPQACHRAHASLAGAVVQTGGDGGAEPVRAQGVDQTGAGNRSIAQGPAKRRSESGIYLRTYRGAASGLTKRYNSTERAQVGKAFRAWRWQRYVHTVWRGCAPVRA
jgi:hypothetical protein